MNHSEIDMEESAPMPLRRDSDHHGRRKLFRFGPDISMGTILSIVLGIVQLTSFIIGCVIAYGIYQADKMKDRMEVSQIRVDADAQRTNVEKNMLELKGDVKEIQRTLGDVKESLGVLKGASKGSR